MFDAVWLHFSSLLCTSAFINCALSAVFSACVAIAFLSTLLVVVVIIIIIIIIITRK